MKKQILTAAAAIVVGLDVYAPILLPHDAPHWVWVTARIVFVLLLMAAAATGAVMWERYGPNGYRLEEWNEARTAKATGIQLLDRRDEHEYDGPATLHYPEGGDR